MGNKWNLTEKSGIYEKCCQLEKVVRSLFQSKNAWVNGFIRLVSLEGTWYYNREVDVFIPVAQNYLEEPYPANTKPENGTLRAKSRDIYWDYLNEEEALQILPNLIALNLQGTGNGDSLSEVCREKLIFLKDGKVYDGPEKKVRLLQNNETAIVLQTCHVEEQYKRTDKTAWNYDIYFWAKAGIIPSVLSAVKECWNTMQFLIDNFNNIDFTDFILQGQESQTEPAEQTKAPVKQEPAVRTEEAAKPSSVVSQETAAATEPSVKTKSQMQPESQPSAELSVPKTTAEAAKAPVREEVKETPVSVKAEPLEAIKSPAREEAKETPVPAKTESVEAAKASVHEEAKETSEPVKTEAAEAIKTPVHEAAKEKSESAKTEPIKAAKLSVREEVKETSELVKPEPVQEAMAPVREEAEEISVSERSEPAGAEKPSVREEVREAPVPAKMETPEKAMTPVHEEVKADPVSEKEESVKESVFVTADYPAEEKSEVRAEQPWEVEGSAEVEIQTEPENPEELEPQKQVEHFEGAEDMMIQREEKMYDEADKIQELLDCDKNRCRLEPYDKDILFDIIRGHWELFDENTDAKEAGATGRSDGQELIARDPKLDIRQGVIGIDFGTKSTVVVRQDTTNRIIPIRIGTGNLSNEVKEEDFENPSIIEFTNVKKFLDDYQKEAGRPHTSCNDIFVSYDAYEDFRNCKPDDFYAYFSELKQWANHEKGSIVIKDKQREEYTMSESMEMAGGVVNPIELYAYYIGLYINNMRNGIYLNYLMSFPVGYSKEVRDFIAKSFYDGIKKSLPASILNDKECMEQFKVELGISEPAAYAVTALEQNHLEPKEESDRLMYGIFDFGGGTTDFDFGICRGATEEEYERDAYDYVLECFGADSDVTLGGENILELMAYQVYQKNLDVFREKKITFTLPLGENGFAGSETLLINSQIARRNMAILKEELRPLWYQEPGWRKKYQLDNESQNEADKEGIVVSLYNMDGEPVPQCILEFSSQDMLEILKNRIQKGIDSFFQCLIKIFLSKEKKNKEAKAEDVIYIFLAGNSSKSVFVKELFQRKIEEYYGKSQRLEEGMANVHFELIDPLTGESENGDHYLPNAKTGVAYGLLKSRDGSSIKIVKNYETDSLQQSRFRYYLGRDHRHYFDCKFSPKEIAYKKWVPFQGASKKVIRIYYTNNPMADSKLEQMPIENVPYKEISIEAKEDAYLFIRTVEPDMIEYAVAKEVEGISDNDIKKCYFN